MPSRRKQTRVREIFHHGKDPNHHFKNAVFVKFFLLPFYRYTKVYETIQRDCEYIK